MNGQKNIELRKREAKRGNKPVSHFGRDILRGKIIKKEEGSPTDVLREDNHGSFLVWLFKENYSIKPRFLKHSCKF